MIAAFLPIYRKYRFISSTSCVIIWVLSSNPVVLVPHLATGFRFSPFTLPATLRTFLHILALHTSLKVPWLPLLLWLRPCSCYNPFHVLKANFLFSDFHNSHSCVRPTSCPGNIARFKKVSSLYHFFTVATFRIFPVSYFIPWIINCITRPRFPNL